VEKYVRKYGDAALIAELTKTVNTHGEARALFSAEVADSLAQIVEAAERYIKTSRLGSRRLSKGWRPRCPSSESWG
jgi:hypothetical protein